MPSQLKALKSSVWIPSSAQDVYNLIRSLDDDIRGLWDPIFVSAVLHSETSGNGFDHVDFNFRFPKDLYDSSHDFEREASVTRTWRRDQDGNFIVVITTRETDFNPETSTSRFPHIDSFCSFS